MTIAFAIKYTIGLKVSLAIHHTHTNTLLLACDFENLIILCRHSAVNVQLER